MFYVRAAISLNNIAASLFERKCFAQASETLRDALETLNCSSLLGREVTHTVESGQTLATRLQRATARLINPEPSEAIIRLVIVNSESLSSKIQARIRRGPISDEACVIRIEYCVHESMTDLATQTAIMLHNLAVLYMCLSSESRTNLHGFQRAALPLMASSYQLLLAQHDVCAADSIRMYSLLSLEITVLGALIAILSGMKLAEQLRAMSGQYLLLQASMQCMESLEDCFRNGQDAAAAA